MTPSAVTTNGRFSSPCQTKMAEGTTSAARAALATNMVVRRLHRSRNTPTNGPNVE
jgi:hypothetical protein